MTIEEKAKAYDEAKARMSIAYNSNRCTIGFMNEIFPELKESEDERMLNQLHSWMKEFGGAEEYTEKVYRWIKGLLEKQGDIIENNMLLPFKEYDNLMDSINKKKKEGYEAGYKQGLIDSKNDQHVQPKFKVGDTIRVKNSSAEYVITDIYGGCYHGKGWGIDIISADRSGDYELVEKQDEQKPIVPKFKVGDIVKDIEDGEVFTIRTVTKDKYIYTDDSFDWIKDQDTYILVEQNPTDKVEPKFKVGDTIIAKPSTCMEHKPFHITKIEDDYYWDGDNTILIGNQNNFELVEQKSVNGEDYDGEDYGIDGLYHAISILERTCGKVDGYQSDDGILEHKCAISAVKRLYEQKSAWSEEDKGIINDIEESLIAYKILVMDNDTELANYIEKEINCIKSLKDKIMPQPQNTWKPSEKQMQALSSAGNSFRPFEEGHKVLWSLYYDLKKLREE